MPTQFETKTCKVCHDPVDPDVPTITEDIPGATLTNRFCSPDCYAEYLAHTAKRKQTPDEYIRAQLEETDINPDLLDD